MGSSTCHVNFKSCFPLAQYEPHEMAGHISPTSELAINQLYTELLSTFKATQAQEVTSKPPNSDYGYWETEESTLSIFFCRIYGISCMELRAEASFSPSQCWNLWPMQYALVYVRLGHYSIYITHTLPFAWIITFYWEKQVRGQFRVKYSVLMSLITPQMEAEFWSWKVT